MSVSTKKIVASAVVVVVLAVSAWTIWRYTHQPRVEVAVPVTITTPTHAVIGYSVQGRAIDSYTYGQGANNLVFIGGIHGGYEWNSVLLAYKFMDYLELNPKSIPANISVTVIPSFNPDGMFKVVPKEGRFSVAEVPSNIASTTEGRFNANRVDLNRNFDCKWQPEGLWRGSKVSAGLKPFSEPESQALKNFVLTKKPKVVVFWHSQSNGIYASQCTGQTLPETLMAMDYYSKASGYPTYKTFDSYTVTGAADDWLASIGIPAMSVELKTHESIEWEKNLAGVLSLFNYYSK